MFSNINGSGVLVFLPRFSAKKTEETVSRNQFAKLRQLHASFFLLGSNSNVKRGDGSERATPTETINKAYFV